MNTFTAIHVQDPGTEPYWTLVDLSSGEELRDAHQYTSQAEAEAMADVLNGKISGTLGDP